MHNNNNIQLPLNFSKKPFVYFFLRAFAWCRRLWRYLLFIAAYFYVGVARNWSQKRQTSFKGQKLRPKPENKSELLVYKNRSPGRSPKSKCFLRLENPLKMHILIINFTSFTAQIDNALHVQGKRVTLASWGAWPLCPVSYTHLTLPTKRIV